MVSSSRPMNTPIAPPRYSSPISFASRLTFTQFMSTLALMYAIIAPSSQFVTSTYLTASDCPVQHCLLDVFQPTKDYFPVKVTTEQNPNFAITYYNHFKVLSNYAVKEDYVITLCGTPVPSNNSMVYRTLTNGTVQQVPLVLAPIAKFVTGPISAVAIDETVTANMMELIGARRTIQAMDVTYVTSPCLQALYTMNEIHKFPSSYGNATLRNQLLSQVDIVLGGNSPSKLNKSVQISVTLENTPLGRLEWIKFMGALFNREHAAQGIYRDTLQRYQNLRSKAQAAAAAGTTPVVAWLEFNRGYGTSPDSWSIQTAQYKNQYTMDAGATLYVPTKQKFTDVTELVQTLMAGAVDIVIDETYIAWYPTGSYVDFLSQWGNLTTDMKFVLNKQVWRHDRMQTAAGGDDWFERAIMQVDAVLSDIITITQPTVLPSTTPRVWFRNFVSGEPLYQTLDRCVDVSAPLFPLLAPPTMKEAICPSLPEETLIGYVVTPVTSSTNDVSSTSVKSSSSVSSTSVGTAAPVSSTGSSTSVVSTNSTTVSGTGSSSSSSSSPVVDVTSSSSPSTTGVRPSNPATSVSAGIMSVITMVVAVMLL